MTPAKAIGRRVHVNLKPPRQRRVSFAAGTVLAGGEITPGTSDASRQAFRSTTN